MTCGCAKKKGHDEYENEYSYSSDGIWEQGQGDMRSIDGKQKNSCEVKKRMLRKRECSAKARVIIFASEILHGTVDDCSILRNNNTDMTKTTKANEQWFAQVLHAAVGLCVSSVAQTRRFRCATAAVRDIKIVNKETVRYDPGVGFG